MKDLADSAGISPAQYAVIIGMLLASIAGWMVVTARRRTGQPLLVTEPRRFAPWRGRHVAVAFFVYIIMPQMALLIAKKRFDIPLDIPLDEKLFSEHVGVDVVTWVLASGSLLTVTAAALIYTFLRIDLQTTLTDLGWTLRKLRSDVGIAVVTFVAAAPIVVGLQIVLSVIYTKLANEPPGHPIQKLVENDPSARILLLCAVQAIVIAPLVEEFIFRVVLQGWLEKAFYVKTISEESESVVSIERDLEIAPPDSTSPQVMWQPIIISSLVFGFMHVGWGPDPVPIFVFAVVLGYVYYKTHRILPCILIHLALNSYSMLMLWLSVNNRVDP